ncbi:MAG: hypothetical protein KZQ82_07250 [Candidatus Thiodiazotropha sp. (ex Lucinoma annulata)]|nr:hypothetical protein [Candidatus Thiodiazotropha sp. (ex Troendleina suluensis)]MCU7883984.1 hypothetical protein [Candidatus Thiodiazotropha sp. (ex Lucinoma annulata)]MCU7946501.1 hypothetical protein [Candidatus Thiodiazotropha sp. (ex Cardiolucina cf. quadrata)]
MAFRAHLTALLGITTFLSVGFAEAAISYYTFEGTVSSTANDNAGAIALAGVQDNQSLAYIFAVDPLLGGSSTQNNGTLIPRNDNVIFDYFFADFLAGSMINEVNGGSHNNPVHIAEYNYGSNNNVSSGGGLQGGSADNSVTITSNALDFTNWVIGTTVFGLEKAYSTGNVSSSLSSSLTLMAISNVNPVPVPPAFLLMGSGLIGLLATRLINSKKA